MKNEGGEVTKMENKLNIRVELHGKVLERFKEIQDSLGIENGTEVFRYLISQYHTQLKEPNAQTRTLTEPSLFGIDLFERAGQVTG
ncbi:MAG: hypothetical protein O8C56_12125 [Candidatus Methanoperedens sp.]|nr:hypothetical protein [Candidatus Methanoperedens sp.]